MIATLLTGSKLEDVHVGGGGGSIVLFDFPSASLIIYSSWRLRRKKDKLLLTSCQDDASVGGVMQKELYKIKGQCVNNLIISEFHDIIIEYENGTTFETFSDINEDEYGDGENWCISVNDDNLTYCSIANCIERFISNKSD